MKGTTQYTGHLKNSGGLQGHSLGESYPWAVVGVLQNADAPLRWKVTNLCTGETLVELHSSCNAAHKHALEFAQYPELVRIFREANQLVILN